MTSIPQPTRADESVPNSRWVSYTWLSRVLRFAIWAVPIILSLFVVAVAARRWPPRDIGLSTIVWWTVVGALAVAVLLFTDRVARRFLPLAALLRMALVFPDQAPSRFGAALRSGTPSKLGSRNPPTSTGLMALVQALSAHDRATRGHSERVRAYSQLIGQEMRLEQDELDRLSWSALLHDVGKLEVPAEILNKKGRPDDQEWAKLRTHPECAPQYLVGFEHWLGDWARAAAEHHERWDGNGYPEGLSGENIHESGRIVAVADAYDVMTSARSYKKSMPTPVAREEIARNAGAQFDPIVVRAFLNVGIGKVSRKWGAVSWLTQVPDLASRAPAAVLVLLVGLGTMAGLIDPETEPADTTPSELLGHELAADAPGSNDQSPEQAATSDTAAAASDSSEGEGEGGGADGGGSGGGDEDNGEAGESPDNARDGDGADDGGDGDADGGDGDDDEAGENPDNADQSPSDADDANPEDEDDDEDEDEDGPGNDEPDDDEPDGNAGNADTSDTGSDAAATPTATPAPTEASPQASFAAIPLNDEVAGVQIEASTPTPTPAPAVFDLLGGAPTPIPTQDPIATLYEPTPDPNAVPIAIPAPIAPPAIPTPTAVPTPTAMPTPTAVPTPTAAPTPTAIPTPTATATPTALPTPTPTATTVPLGPLAVDDVFSIGSAEQQELLVLDNDIDLGGSGLDPTTLTITVAPLFANTTAGFYGPRLGHIDYQSLPGYVGPDSFQYQICDFNGLCNSAFVLLSIEAP